MPSARDFILNKKYILTAVFIVFCAALSFSFFHFHSHDGGFEDDCLACLFVFSIKTSLFLAFAVIYFFENKSRLYLRNFFSSYISNIDFFYHLRAPPSLIQF